MKRKSVRAMLKRIERGVALTPPSTRSDILCAALKWGTRSDALRTALEWGVDKERGQSK